MKVMEKKQGGDDAKTCVSHICNLLCNIVLDKYGLSSNNFHTLLSPLNGLHKGKYINNT